MPLTSRQAQLEATHNSKQTDFEMDFEGDTKALSTTKALARAENSGAERLRSTAAQCTVRNKALSKGISTETLKLRRIQQRLLEQRFGALTGFEARPSSDFERPVAAKHGRSVVTNANHALCDVFERSC